MKRITTILITICFFSSIIHGQVFCSKYIPQVFFGPKNVNLNNEVDLSSFYIHEIEKGINDLINLKIDDETAREIVTLSSIKDAWLIVEDTLAKNMKIDIEVIEYFTFQNSLELIHGFPKNVPVDCLYKNPTDCLTYDLISKNKIEIIDDYGNKLIEGFHDFYNVSFRERGEDLEFYRTRHLRK